MFVLTLNCGSSSVKFSLIETNRERIAANSDREIARGLIEKIGLPSSIVKISSVDPGKPGTVNGIEILDHREAVEVAIRMLCEQGFVPSRDAIEAVGHRVVHGGERFSASVAIDREVLEGIMECIELAPLHNPANLSGIRAATEALPGKPQVAVFDTGFHATIPDFAHRYAIPDTLYRRHKIRRYGFHGLSHRFVSFRLSQLLGRRREDMKIITCHLGNGCSLAALDQGRSVDTTMGFTPCEGLVMGTRSGSIDPAVILHVIAKEELTIAEADTMLNKHCGLYGLSGISNDMRELIKERDAGNDRARLAVDVFIYTLKKQIGAFLAVLGGADAIIFTGGIGENAPEIRERALHGLGYAGIQIDPAANSRLFGGAEGLVSAPDSPTSVHVIPTNEELVIARDTVRCLTA